MIRRRCLCELQRVEQPRSSEREREQSESLKVSSAGAAEVMDSQGSAAQMEQVKEGKDAKNIAQSSCFRLELTDR